MNKKVPFAVIAGALAASALVAPISGAAQAPAQVESGLYFTNPEGGNGEFYSFTKWASLTPTEQSNLVLKYKPENIKIFNKVEDKLASLSATVTAESFDGAATAYTEGDIEGTFVDATTGDKIVVAPVVEEVTVESVMAINDTEVKVTFDKAVTEDIALADVTVTEKASAGKVYIKSVKLAEDKKSLDVVFYDTLKADKTYDFAIKVGESTVKSSLDFTVGEPAEIVLAKQTIGNNGKLEYKVVDKNGLDITKDTKVVVNSDKSAKVIASKGEVTTTLENETAFVELSYILKDGTVVKSPRVVVTAEADKAAAFDTNWTLAPTIAEPNYKADDYKQTTTLNLGTPQFLDVELVDQFGERFADESVVKFETLDASVAIVDESTGKVTPRKVGKAVIKASIVNGSTVVASKVFELNVVDTAKLAGVQVDSNAIEVTKNFTNKIKTTLVDQFGNPFEGTVTVESTDTAVATVAGGKTQTATNGKLDLTVTGVAKGATTVKITAGDFSQTVKVNVVEAGAVADYKVEGFSSELLVKNDEATTTDETKMILSVKSVDANGLTNSVLTEGYTVEVKDANGDKVTVTDGDLADGITIDQSAFAGKKGPFTATVKVGSLTVFSDEFVVTDNRVAPKYTIKSNKTTVTASPVTANDLLKDSVFDFASIEGKTVAITGAEFVSSNEEIIKFNDTKTNFVSNQDGSASIYVDTVDVEVTTTEGGAKETFTLDLNGLKVDVNVIAKAEKDKADGEALITGFDQQEAAGKVGKSVTLNFASDNGIFKVVGEGTAKEQGANQEGKFKVTATFEDETTVTNTFIKRVNNKDNNMYDLTNKVTTTFYNDMAAKDFFSWNLGATTDKTLNDQKVTKVVVEFEYKGQTIVKELTAE